MESGDAVLTRRVAALVVFSWQAAAGSRGAALRPGGEGEGGGGAEERDQFGQGGSSAAS